MAAALGKVDVLRRLFLAESAHLVAAPSPPHGAIGRLQLRCLIENSRCHGDDGCISFLGSLLLLHPLADEALHLCHRCASSAELIMGETRHNQKLPLLPEEPAWEGRKDLNSPALVSAWVVRSDGCPPRPTADAA